MEPRELIDAQKELLAHAYGQAQAYTNVLLLAGYAGFFGIWSFLSPTLSKGQILWSAFLVSISLATFIVWEVVQSYFRSRSLLGLARAIEVPDLVSERLAQYWRNEQNRTIAQGRAWVVAFGISVVTGLLGVLVLLWAFVRSLWALYAV
jgi:hypothetical protein